MKYDSITEITKAHIAFLKEKKWDHQHTPSMVVISLMTEIGELLEHLLWKEDGEILEFIKAKKNKEALAQELADVLFNILELSHRLKISLPDAAQAKLAKNRLKYENSKWTGNMAKNHKSSFAK